MRLLVTGGAGCLGANLIEEYLPQGHEILVIDNFATGRHEALPRSGAIQIIDGSVADRELIDSAFLRFVPTHVIHSAASYKDPTDWREDAATNVTGTINIVEAARRAGVRRLVYFQTALCYGRPERVPIPIDHPLRPFTSYGISKTAAEAYVALSDLSWVSLRLANVTGPWLAIGPIPTFYKRLKAGQTCFCTDAMRDFLDISDFLALMRMVLHQDAPTGIFNVSTGEGRTIAEVLDTVAMCVGTQPRASAPTLPPNTDDVPAIVLDASRTREAFGWTVKVSFSESIARIVRWYDANDVPAIHSHLQPRPQVNG